MEALQFKQVTKQFSDGKSFITALHPTDFSVQKGEFVAVIGPSGSGKSTFLTIAGGLQTPTSGDVFIGGESMYALSAKKREQLRLNEIGFILQASNLVPFLTVEQQLDLVDRVAKKKAKLSRQELFDTLGIADLRHKYPQDLSGGERQRVAIARALYNQPTLILADEPTASLDSERAYEVVKLLAHQTKAYEKATIMVTHDKRLLSYCDRVFEMKDGVLTEV